MKKLFYLTAIISLAIFIYSVVNTAKQFDEPAFLNSGTILGMEDNNKFDASDELGKQIKAKIDVATTKAEKDQRYYFLVSLLVTGLTAASTLVSGIQAAKKDDTNDRRAQMFAIIVAILTFFSSIASAVSTHLNEVKTEDVKTVTDYKTHREAFYLDFNKATDVEKPNVIARYKVIFNL